VRKPLPCPEAQPCLYTLSPVSAYRDEFDAIRYLNRTVYQWDALSADFRIRISSATTSGPGHVTAP
jgi:hypothetical protein